MEILLLYSVLMVIGCYYFYLLGYNEANKDWLTILHTDPNKTAGQLLEIIEEFEQEDE